MAQNNIQDDAVEQLDDVAQLLRQSNKAISDVRQQSVKRVMMSGCVDLMHSGHVACFAEASQYGDLYVCLGSDKNIGLLKHKPTIPEQERVYMVQAVRYVHEARISRGSGDLDWLTEVEDIKPHYFFVNEDGDRPAKKKACARLGITYIVGKRKPAEGLEARSSTNLKKTIARKNVSAEVTQPAKKPRLYYFDGIGRAAPIRFLLEAIGLKYENVFLRTRAEYVALMDSGKLDFNQVPALELEEGCLAQSDAIVNYLAEVYGLQAPEDASPMQKYYINEIYSASKDLRVRILGTPFRLLEGEKIEDLVPPIEAHIERWGSQVENVMKRAGPSPLLGGTSLTFADVTIFEAFNLACEIVGSRTGQDAPTLLAPYPTVLKHFEVVRSLPRIAQYLKSERRRPVPVGDEGIRYAKEVNAALGR